MKKIKRKIQVRKEIREENGHYYVRNRQEDYYISLNFIQKAKPSSLNTYKEE